MAKKSEKAIMRAAISQAAISELDKLSLFLDTELEVTASMSIEEIEDELREMGLDPHQPAPAKVRQLIFAGAGEQQEPATVSIADERAYMEDLDQDNTKMPVYV